MFGAPDDGGAGPLDAALLLVGAAAIVAGLTSLVPTWVLVAGLVVFGLGAVLPLRSFWRRAAAARRAARLRATVGDGVPLRTDHPAVAALVAAHARCTVAGGGVAAPRRVQVEAVAHAALLEAATLLDGRVPGSAARSATSSNGSARSMRWPMRSPRRPPTTSAARPGPRPGWRSSASPAGRRSRTPPTLARELRPGTTPSARTGSPSPRAASARAAPLTVRR